MFGPPHATHRPLDRSGRSEQAGRPASLRCRVVGSRKRGGRPLTLPLSGLGIGQVLCVGSLPPFPGPPGLTPQPLEVPPFRSLPARRETHLSHRTSEVFSFFSITRSVNDVSYLFLINLSEKQRHARYLITSVKDERRARDVGPGLRRGSSPRRAKPVQRGMPSGSPPATQNCPIASPEPPPTLATATWRAVHPLALRSIGAE